MTIAAGGEPNGQTALVFGSGAGGSAVAVDLAISGWEVLLSDPYPIHVPSLGQLGYVGVSGSGSVLLLETDLDLAQAVAEASLVVISTLSTAGADVVDQLAGLLGSGQTVIVGCGGLVSLALENSLGNGHAALIGELACFPYSSRFRSDGSLHIRRRRPVRYAATAPYLTPKLGEAMPVPWVGEPAANVLHAAVLNPNFMVHPASVVVNVASRDRGEAVPQEGLTAGARRIAEELDRDKRAILAALELPDVSLHALMTEMEKGGSKSRVVGDGALEPILDRYLTEDCGWGLSLLSELAAAADVAVPTIDSVRTVLAASLSDPLPTFPFELVGMRPEQLASGGRR